MVRSAALAARVGDVPRARLDGAVGLALGAGLIAVAFVTTGSFDSSLAVSAANTWTEIVLTLLGAVAVSATLLLSARASAWGAGAVALFAGLGAYTALSITWSVQPDNSWQAASLTLAYVAVFAGAAALARLAPGRWPGLLVGVALVTVAVSGYALLAKVFPGSLAAGETQGRLQAPLGYWNATGGAAVLGLAPCLWGATRRVGSLILRAACVPALALLLTVVILSYSRTAALVGALVLAAWLGFVPGRLRAAAILAPAGVGAAVLVAWALARPGLTGDGIALAVRTSAGHSFGLVILFVTLASAAAGAALVRAADRVAVPEATRLRIGKLLLVLVALMPVLAVAGLAASSRGLTGEISHAWNSLTSVNLGVGNGASRLGQLGSSRPLYWSEGIDVGEHALLNGVGALGYATARTRYTHNPYVAEHAHSYVIQTFADLGLLGLTINLALLLAWGRAVTRAVAGRTRWAGLSPALADVRAGLLALLLVALAYGLLSAVDWTWFFPAVSLPALLAAGWLAGRGPLAKPVGMAMHRPRPLDRPLTGAAVATLAALALFGAWLIWQPLRSAQSAAAALTAASHGQTRAAFADARDAEGADPLALEPRLVLSALYRSIGEEAAARAQLVRATAVQPDNSQSWLALGSFDLDRGQPSLALPSLIRAVALDPTAPVNTLTLRRAQAALRAHRPASARGGG